MERGRQELRVAANRASIGALDQKLSRSEVGLSGGRIDTNQFVSLLVGTPIRALETPDGALETPGWALEMPAPSAKRPNFHLEEAWVVLNASLGVCNVDKKWLLEGIDKEMKLGAKHNLKKKKKGRLKAILTLGIDTQLHGIDTLGCKVA
ncbi:hypothetical protein PIB30_037146 [Stylosanthes scabra]|uniref:Uncharacterized protein n=1 Tax=Stylosanthes scabra TaxID=79078 RepID=A0ABU6RDP9_9FABA|nr:hypothetical protein [Stylosanthes scabra]